MGGHIWGVCPVTYENMFIGDCKNPCTVEDVKELEREIEMEKKDWKSSFADYERILRLLSVAAGDNLEGVYQAFKARLIEELGVTSIELLYHGRLVDEHQTAD